MPEINQVGPIGIPPENKSPANAANANTGVSFDDMVKESDKVAFRPDIKPIASGALSQIPLDMIPNDKTSRDIVGYQKTFLGTFSKGTKAEINRTDEKITVNSPLGNMKFEAQGEKSIYVEIPQGSFVGMLNKNEDGSLLIQSEDKKKSIHIQPQANGEIKVTNKGIDEGVFLVFKPVK